VRDRGVRIAAVLVVALLGLLAVSITHRQSKTDSTVGLNAGQISRLYDLVDQRANTRNAQTCSSLGADLVLFKYLQDRGLATKDPRFANLLGQAVATKMLLRTQLHCPPYPAPPTVPPVPAEPPAPQP
jgi:hypothetical protein